MSFDLKSQIERFAHDMPHLEKTYASRLWGHRLHSLCSYQGKLKPALAHMLIRYFVSPNSAVLDPLGGVGTVSFEAALAGNRTLSNDLSPLAAIVAAGKIHPMSVEESMSAVDKLEILISETELDDIDYEAAEFGLNSAVRDYYHPGTLEEILKARKVLRINGWQSDAFVWASLLHILHGNRPYALSRRSHPITPFSPSGEFVYQPLVQKLRKRVLATAQLELGNEFLPGESIYGDFMDLRSANHGHFDTIITSPPFIGMRFDRPNWLRLWFCGWGEGDFHTRSLQSLDRRQTKTRDCYSDFFAMSDELLTDDGFIVMHVGGGGRGDLPGDLKRIGGSRFELAGEVIEDSSKHEAHGIRDKGLTTRHHLLFFSR